MSNPSAQKARRLAYAARSGPVSNPGFVRFHAKDRRIAKRVAARAFLAQYLAAWDEALVYEEALQVTAAENIA